MVHSQTILPQPQHTKQPKEKWIRTPHVSFAQIVMLTFILSDELQHLTIFFPASPSCCWLGRCFSQLFLDFGVNNADSYMGMGCGW